MTYVTGIDEFAEAARDIAATYPKQAGIAAVNAGLSVFVRAYQRAAPNRKGSMRKAAGKRFRRASGSDVAGKAGYDVGKRKYSRSQLVSGQAPHSHLYVHGTAARKRKKIGGRYRHVESQNRPNIEHLRRTGKSPPHPGIAGVVSGVIGSALQAMTDKSRQKLDELAASRGI